MFTYIWSQEWLLVTDSTSSMYGPRTQMGAQLKETSLGGTLVQEILDSLLKLDPTFHTDFLKVPPVHITQVPSHTGLQGTPLFHKIHDTSYLLKNHIK